MAPQLLVTQLSQLLGLDDETTQQQIMPALEQMKTSREIGTYLETLIGTGAAQTAFIRSYFAYRFPPSISSKPSSSSSSSSTLPPASRFPTTLARGLPPPAPASKAKVAASNDHVVDFSESIKAKLLSIDRTLRSFRKGKGKGCFCAARDHALSPYIPICDSCALVLCVLNSPSSPCPSCGGASLISSSAAASYIAALELEREELVIRESNRLRSLAEAEERERNAIVFPTLGARPTGNVGVTAARGYSNIAGGGPSLSDRIDRAYEEGISLNGREFGYRKVDQNVGKVLRLDMKTKKVKMITKKKVLLPAKAAAEVKSISIDSDNDDDDDVLERFIDLFDDGQRSSSTIAATLSAPSVDRTFYNTTIEFDHPKWIEEVRVFVEPELTIVAEKQVNVKAVPGAAVSKTTTTTVPGEKKKRKMKKKETIV